MRRGLGWTFHAWGHSGALYLDNYVEERPAQSGADSRLVGKHYEYDSGLNQQTKRYYVGGRLVATRSGTTLRYVQPDYLGSTATLTDPSGAVVAREKYSAFGERRRGESPLITDQLYTGQRYNALSSLYHYSDGKSAGRFYDPLLGRFVQADSVTPPGSQGLNRYAYGLNNPVKYVDPNGQTPWDVVDVIFWGLSVTDFRRDPSFANAGWLLLDTISLAPALPSTGWIRFPGRAGKVADEVVQFAALYASEARSFMHIAHKPGAYTLLQKFLSAVGDADKIKGAQFELEYALEFTDEIVEIGRELPGRGVPEIDFVLEGNVFVNVKNFDWNSNFAQKQFGLEMIANDYKRQYEIYKEYGSEVRFVFKGSVPDFIRQELEAVGAIVDVLP